MNWGVRYPLKIKSSGKLCSRAASLTDIVLFCDGDFWHGYNYENKKKPAKKFWKKKIEGNIKRDKLVSRKLRYKGWSVLRFWEHDLEKKPELCKRKILRHAKQL